MEHKFLASLSSSRTKEASAAQICPGLNANEIQIPHDKHHKVSSPVKSHQNTLNSEALIKQYLRSILDISAAGWCDVIVRSLDKVVIKRKDRACWAIRDYNLVREYTHHVDCFSKTCIVLVPAMVCTTNLTSSSTLITFGRVKRTEWVRQPFYLYSLHSQVKAAFEASF